MKTTTRTSECLTPKEKALDLYNNFRIEMPVLEANYRAKRYARIVVDEVLEEIFADTTQGRYTYWVCVKNEIEKL